MQIIKKIGIAVMVMFLNNCATTGSLTSLSSSELKQLGSGLSASLDINITEFDPGLEGDSDSWKSKGIWPELRRTESRKFAVDLKKAFDKVGTFEEVYVTPSPNYLSDITIEGKIKKSNGEVLHLDLLVKDSSNKTILKKTYRHRVKEEFFNNLRNKEKDPYAPAWNSIVEDIVNKLLRNKNLNKVSTLTEVRYAAALNEEAFSDALIKKTKNRHKPSEYELYLLGFIPAENDPLFIKAKNVRSKDLSFRSDMQTHYQSFLNQVEPDYKVWQETAFKFSKAKREAEGKAATAAVVGALFLVAAAYAGADDVYYADPSTVGLALGAAAMFDEYSSNKAEGQAAQANLNQIAGSLEAQVAPKVIKFEGTSVKLEGSISQQFNQWQAYLAEYYVGQNKIKKEIEVIR